MRLRLPGADLKIINLYDPTPRHAVGLAYPTRRHQNLAAKELATLCESTMPELLSHSARPPRPHLPSRVAR
jgi:hypothetical protein